MTTSALERQRLKFYAVSGRCYITKRIDFSKLAKLVIWIEDWWLAVVTVPQ